MSIIEVPKLSLVVLVGVSGSGKSTFAREHFGPYEVLSSDAFRGLVANDETDQSATAAAFDALRYVAGKRLDAGLLTVVDATSVQPNARRALVELARAHDVLPVAIVLDLPEPLCLERNASRGERSVPAGVIRRQADQLRRGIRGLSREGFRKVHILRTPEEVRTAGIERRPTLNDRSDDHGPFDAIGDVHGCRSELETLLGKLGYEIRRDESGRPIDASHPEGRRALFLGDLIDRGPDSVGVLRLVMGMVDAGHAIAIPGNHEDKFVRALRGRTRGRGAQGAAGGGQAVPSRGLAETLAELSAEPREFQDRAVAFCAGLVAHLVLDDGRLVVAHAGLIEQYHGRASGRVRAFALYGDTTGETDEYGLPVRLPWARDYRGRAAVLYGHTPVPSVEWVNNTACLDTACVFGGSLSAMRYPEREIVSVPAERQYADPIRPLVAKPAEREPGVLSLADVQGKLLIETTTHGRIGIREEQSAGGLETMSRWAADPRRLIYLPPTMAPANTSKRSGYLEHPDEAFAYYRGEGVHDVICEEKHMGSRAVVLVTRDPRPFAAPEGWRGIVHTRTGRPFFEADVAKSFLARLDGALDRAGLWEELGADWVLLDGEVLPWSLKAEDLIRDLYASVAAAGTNATAAALRALDRAADAGVDVSELVARTTARADDVSRFRDAYRRYVGQPGEVRFAPFQVLAAGSETFETRDHGWHLSIADRLVSADADLLTRTGRLRLDLADETSAASGISWWEELTGAGGEGMVVKPFANLTRKDRGLVQPGMKVRGREYLRIIYGPDYTEESNLARLRDRDTGRKRSLATREYALGLEALRRFTAGEPLWRVHQAVFGVLALESDPIDPRL